MLVVNPRSWIGAPPNVALEITVFQVVPPSVLKYRKVAPDEAVTAMVLPSGEAIAPRIPPNGGLPDVGVNVARFPDFTIVFSCVPAPASPPQARMICGSEDPATGVARATAGLVGIPLRQSGFRCVHVVVPVAW